VAERTGKGEGGKEAISGITDEELAKIEVELCAKCAGHGAYCRHGIIVPCENCDSTGVVSQIPTEKKVRKEENQKK
jgi:hypothetical protein